MIVENSAVSYIENLQLENCHSNLFSSSINLKPAEINKELKTIFFSMDFDRNYGGGALFFTNSNTTFNRVNFNNNVAYNGGAIFATNSSYLILQHCKFVENVAFIQGGSIATDSSSVVISNSVFNSNVAIGVSTSIETVGGNGGALYFGAVFQTNSTLLTVNNTFYNNSAKHSGGAIYIQSGSIGGNHSAYAYESRGDTFRSNKAVGDSDCVSVQACDVRGGAIFMSIQSALISYSTFFNNSARSFSLGQYSQGGAIFSTNLIEVKEASYFNLSILHSSFSYNSAIGFGGAVYVYNQRMFVDNSTFSNNFAGDETRLFLDLASGGGALWYSNDYELGAITNSSFSSNYVWGGWGGALFLSGVPMSMSIVSSNFTSNEAISSYSFSAQGGAIKASNNVALLIDSCKFHSNTARPRVDINPVTYSGNGGAIFGQTITLSILNSDFVYNHALTGQFDAGSSGGAIQLENVATGYITYCNFENNGASGYFGYSSYASSGAGGAVLLKFSNVQINATMFAKNWVSVGGTQISTGGAVAVLYFYNGNSATALPCTVIEYCTFYSNFALSQTCYLSGSRAGQGGALALVGVTKNPAVISNCNFTLNAAISPQSSTMSSFGGALVISVGTNVTIKQSIFGANYAKHGLGNDIASVTGDQQGLSYVRAKYCTFEAITVPQIISITKIIGTRNLQICDTLNEVFGQVTRRLSEEDSPDSDSGDSQNTNKIYSRKIEISDKIQLTSQKILELTAQTSGRDSVNAEKLLQVHMMYLKELNNEIDVLKQTLRPRRDLLSLRFSKSFVAPSIVVNNGYMNFYMPTILGIYHVFFGNLGYLVSSISTAALPSNIYCAGAIYGSNKGLNRGLLLSAVGSSVTVATNSQSPLYISELHLFNSTLYISNNIHIQVNSTIDSSTISAVVSPIFGRILSSAPVLSFDGPLFTGALRLDDGASPVYLKYDDDYVSEITTSQQIIIDGCILSVANKLQLTTPYDRSSLTPSNTNYVYIRLIRNAHINMTSNSTLNVMANTIIAAETSTSPTLWNNGTINLLGNPGVPEATSIFPSGTINDALTSEISLGSILSIFGDFIQTPTGSVTITLNSSFQTKPVISMSSNYSFLGKLIVGFNGNPELSLYSTNPSTFLVTSFTKVKANPLGKLSVISSLPGIGFTGQLTPVTNQYGLKQYQQALILSSVSCADILGYYGNMATQSATKYPCYICLQNSSCNYCNGACVEAGTCNEANDDTNLYEYSCCESNCNAPNGQCQATTSSNQDFTCACNQFYDGASCSALSLESTMLITASVFVATFSLITFLYYRYSKGQKSFVLEELRQGLLFNNDGALPEQAEYIRSMQQALILKDVFVKYEEIKIESQIGEGSFGVVYKASFRGAQVAVKQMRSLFAELTEADIDGFRREAYMMSRLRHPNIVLVMGISLVDQEVPKRQFTSRSLNKVDPEDDSFRKPGNEGEKKLPPAKTICIITEYLEQGSLADVLYGPTKLPAEVWTYDLILTCALQAARGMLYLHSQTPQICHRDLKGSNLVVDDHWVVKVTDFGMSRIVPEKVLDLENKAGSGGGGDRMGLGRDSDVTGVGMSGGPLSEVDNNSIGSGVTTSRRSFLDFGGMITENLEMTSNQGTTAWCAPELLTVSSTTKYSVKVDVYSFGMVLWEIWEKKRPFEHLTSRFDIIDAIVTGKRPDIGEACPPAFRSLIQRCWQQDPSRRPTFQYIVRYLKDELARVKRQRSTFTSTASNGRGSEGYSFGARTMSNAFSDNFTSRANSMTSAHITGTDLTKTSAHNESEGTGTPKPTRHSDTVSKERPSSSSSSSSLLNFSWTSKQQLQRRSNSDASDRSTSTSSTSSSSAVWTSSGKLTSDPIPLLPPSRGPLVAAFNRGISFLAESPIVTPGTSSSYEEREAPGRAGSTSGSSSAGSAGAVQGAGQGQSSIFPNRNNAWRDSYVLKFSGWRASAPDSGLPPSLTGTGPSAGIGTGSQSIIGSIHNPMLHADSDANAPVLTARDNDNALNSSDDTEIDADTDIDADAGKFFSLDIEDDRASQSSVGSANSNLSQTRISVLSGSSSNSTMRRSMPVTSTTPRSVGPNDNFSIN